MARVLIYYPKCSTCQKAKKWLDEQGIPYEQRHIIEDNPTAPELSHWIGQSGLPVKKFFNTSGMMYKEQGLKDKLALLSEQEQIQLLASHGMLVKRPLLVSDEHILVGFKPEEWQIIKD